MRVRNRHSYLAVAAIVVVVSGAAMTTATASAGPGPEPSDTTTALLTWDDADALVAELGESSTAGLYENDAGRITVAVTDRAAADAVRAAGGEAELVTYSTAELTAVEAALMRSARIPGTSWGIDPVTNRVSVKVDSTVTGTRMDRLRSVTDSLGDAVRVTRIPGTWSLAAKTTGGQTIENFSGSWPCTIGFNVRNPDGVKYFVTAGHCVENTRNWYKRYGHTYLGFRVDHQSQPRDFGLVKYDNPTVTVAGTVSIQGRERDITTSRYPRLNEGPTARAGRTSNDLIGKVIALNETVTFEDGRTISGLTITTHCVERGDSGGPLYYRRTALGITVGGTDVDEPCDTSVSRRTAYTPIQYILDYYGLEVY